VNNPIANLNKAFDHKVRLGIMSMLMANGKAEFTTLKSTLEVTDGNLASHMKALEKEGYVRVTKQFIDRKPNTVYVITSAGSAAFKNHIDALEYIIKNTNI
jgi:DNA-binding MarR family transcriptional regulator